jgi:sulfide:quinone oxidoreductase
MVTNVRVEPWAVERDGHHVVIVGGGIAALEFVLALHDLAGERAYTTLISPNPDFSLRPLAVLVPFGRGKAPTVPLTDVLTPHRGAVKHDSVVEVDAARHLVICESGDEVPYDSLVLAPGARSVPAFGKGLTFDPFKADAVSGIVADLEQGWSKSVAFVVPSDVTWPLPLYELALMTAEQVAGMDMGDVSMHFVTPESRPLGIFGHEASDTVMDLLTAAGIAFRGSVSAGIPRSGRVDLGIEGELSVDSIVSIPRLEGPGILGLPTDGDGFIVTDAEGHVAEQPDVWAVGDATQQPIKQGGLACQQADAVATRLAAYLGADVTVEPPALQLRGRLIAGRQDRFLRRPLGTATSETNPQPLWWPPAKVASRYLAPYLEARGVMAPGPHLPDEPDEPEGVDVHVPIDWNRARRVDVLGLSTLGPPL